MGRLFWKFFLAYWVAIFVAVISVGVTAWLYRLAEEDIAPSIEVGPRAGFLVRSAEKKLEEEGLAALRGQMEKWGRHSPVLLFAVDDGDRDLLGRAVPAEALRRARLLAEEDEDSRVVRLIRLPDGESCLLFVPVRAAPLWEQFLFAGRPLPPRVPLTAGIFAGLVFGALLAWYFARPIGHLRRAFSELSKGRLDTRVAARIGRRRDEVADLGRDFDRMAEQLQTLIGAQQSLLHDVSHELRSPLARLQAAIGLARQNPRKLDGSLERIEREAIRLDELVGHVLTLSRLGTRVSGESLGRSERVDLADLVGAVAEDARFEARASDRDVAFSAEGELMAEVRVELVHRAVENVVRNAIKHTTPGTAVEVDVRRSPSGNEAVLTVADQGPGVAAGELEAIFEPFYRGTHGQPGSGFGLGLAIARRAVEAHGGRVSARNRPEGGLLIEMCLPLDR